MHEVVHPQSRQFSSFRHSLPGSFEAGLMPGGIEQGAMDTEREEVVVRRRGTEFVGSFHGQLGSFESFFVERYRSDSAGILRALWLDIYKRLFEVEVYIS